MNKMRNIFFRKSSTHQSSYATKAVIVSSDRQLKTWNMFLLSITALLLIQTGCKKFVDVGLPSDQLVTASVFDNDALATGAVVNMYARMQTENSNVGSYYIARFTGLLSDELAYGSTNTDLLSWYTNNLVATDNSFVPQFWSLAYSYIYQCNAILEALPGSVNTHDWVRQQLSGEARFVRAFWYFYLVNFFGDVPLATSTNYTVNTALARAPKDQVYGQILLDLQQAENLLSDGYVNGGDTIPVAPAAPADRIRPTKWAARALQARVYLYLGKYDSAEAKATQVIGNTGQYGLLSDLSTVFLKNSREAIWQLAVPTPSSATINTVDGNQFILTFFPLSYLTSLGLPLLNSFESGDNRKAQWIRPYTTTSAPITTYYYPYKYRVGTPATGVVTEYTMVLRLAEQYLIRAEARAQQNKLQGAIDDVNYIRLQHGGLTTPLPLPGSQPAALATILHERQVELFTEWGNRWFDLIRTGTINSVMGAPGNVCQTKGGIWNPDGHQLLVPIPQSDLSRNPNLTQNPGYN